MELPYIFVQTMVYGVITYFMINFERAASKKLLYFCDWMYALYVKSLKCCVLFFLCVAGKFFLYVVFMFLTFCYFTYYGMMAVGLTPSQHLAAVISSAFYSLWNLLSGFLVPKPVSWFCEINHSI